MVKEVVELIKEHRPVEREFVVSAGECCYAYQCALQTQSTVVHLPCLPSAPLTFHPLLLALVCRWRLAWSGRWRRAATPRCAAVACCAVLWHAVACCSCLLSAHAHASSARLRLSVATCASSRSCLMRSCNLHALCPLIKQILGTIERVVAVTPPKPPCL